MTVETKTMMLSLRVDPAAPVAAAIQQVLGCPLPAPCTETSSPHANVLWLGPDEFLILTSSSPALPDQLREAIGDEFAPVIDVSAQRTTLLLEGPGTQVRDVLAQGCAIDLDPRVSPPGTCVQTLIAQTGVVLRVLGPGTISLLVRPSFAPYLAAWLADACSEFHDVRILSAS